MEQRSGAAQGSVHERNTSSAAKRAAVRSKPRLLFLFPHAIADELQKVESGISPTERMYGAYELSARGWNVAYSDSRFSGLFSGLLRTLRQYGIIGITLGTIRDMARSDVVIVKDDFSAMTAIAARLLGKKLVFLDSMFAVPQRWWKTLGVWISLRLAHETICYSAYQRKLWVERFGATAEHIRVLPYTIDTAFYKRHAGDWQPGRSRKLLAVGRDVGRDYGTLVEALRGTDLKLDLITLPYLVRGLNVESNEQITMHQRLSYEELFALYRECAVVVIPLKPGITYPSGIRGLFEAMVLRRPFVVTRTEVLQEYMEGLQDVVPARDVAALREAMLANLQRGEKNQAVIDLAAKIVEEKYDVAVFADGFEAMLRELLPSQAAASK